MLFFLDANVLFAAAITPRGKVQDLFELAGVGYCDLCTSPYAITETRRNVIKKYPRAIARLEQLLSQLMVTAEANTGLVAWAQRYLPVKDAPILAAAVAAQVDYLVTGDKKHFGELYGKALNDVRVIDLAKALAVVFEAASDRL